LAPRPAPSGTPRDQATPALVVAIAFAPAPAIATAEATSHAFGNNGALEVLLRACPRLSGDGQPVQLGTAGSLPVQLLGVLALIGEVVTVSVPSLR